MRSQLFGLENTNKKMFYLHNELVWPYRRASKHQDNQSQDGHLQTDQHMMTEHCCDPESKETKEFII